MLDQVVQQGDGPAHAAFQHAEGEVGEAMGDAA